MKKVAFEPEAFEQLGEWGKEDKKVFKKILELIKPTFRTPNCHWGKLRRQKIKGSMKTNI